MQKVETVEMDEEVIKNDVKKIQKKQKNNDNKMDKD